MSMATNYYFQRSHTAGLFVCDKFGMCFAYTGYPQPYWRWLYCFF